MSVIKVNNITNRDGTSGPVIAGITTVSSTSHLVVPTGSTGQRVALAPDPYINNLVLALPFNSESVFTDVSPRRQGEFSGRGSVGFGTTALGASLPYGQSGVSTTSVGIVTFSKYYGTSVGFNTSISYTQALQNVNSSDYQFGGQDFTIEGWVYMRSLTEDYGVVVKCSDDSSWSTGWTFYMRGSGRVGLWRSGTGIDGQSYNTGTETSSTYSALTWRHIAIVRNNLTLSFYVDGVLDRSLLDFVNYIPTAQISIGNDIASNYALNGYIQDLRIYKGVAKYTSNFTPPNQIAL